MTISALGQSLFERLQGLERRLLEHMAAREEAEASLARKSLELHEANRHLAHLNASLEQRVEERTRQLEEQRRQAEHLAQCDPLTGLPNRLMYRRHMQRVLEHGNPDEIIAILYLDLDGFKAVNDTYGHLAGDDLLCSVAERLRSLITAETLVARLGGDEFAIVQTGARQPEAAQELAEHIISRLRMPFLVHSQQIRIGTSIGIAMQARAGTSTEMLLHYADTALYRAKRRQRGSFELFRPEMELENQAQRALERDLKDALPNDQLVAFYQPLVEAATGSVIGFEALLRWVHPERGMVSPTVFIPVAEELGLIHDFGAWMLKQACHDAASWPVALKVAVNLSPAQFLTGSLLQDVTTALAASGIAPERLELEITESVLLQENQSTLEALQQLRAIGTRLSMDDFGTGYSSLSYINRFPFDKIKIDRSFVEGLSRPNGGLEIVRAIVGLGKALNLKILAEGVETPEQWRILRREGCDELQGFLFSKPRPYAELAPFLAADGPVGRPGALSVVS